MVIPNGRKVMLFDLKARSDLNDLSGTVVSYDEATTRHGIRLGDGTAVAIKAANLREIGASRPLKKRVAIETSALVENQGWEQAMPKVLGLLSKHSPQLCHSKMVTPADVMRTWASEHSLGTHIWALAVLAALLQTINAARAVDGLEGTLLEGIEMTPLGMQALYERAWAAGFGNGAYFDGKLAGKAGAPAHTGPADLFEVLVYLGVDAWSFNVFPGQSEMESDKT